MSLIKLGHYLCKMAASLQESIAIALLLMVSVDSLYSTLKVMTRPIDTKHKKVAFKDNENGEYS